MVSVYRWMDTPQAAEDSSRGLLAHLGQHLMDDEESQPNLPTGSRIRLRAPGWR